MMFKLRAAQRQLTLSTAPQLEATIPGALTNLAQVNQQIQDLSETLIRSSGVQILAQGLATQVRSNKLQPVNITALQRTQLNDFCESYQVDVGLNNPPSNFNLPTDLLQLDLAQATRLMAQLDAFHQKLLGCIQTSSGLEQTLLAQFQFAINELRALINQKFELSIRVIANPVF